MHLQHSVSSAVVIPITTITPENHVVCTAFKRQQSMLNSMLLRSKFFIYLMLENFQGLFLKKILLNIPSLSSILPFSFI